MTRKIKVRNCLESWPGINRLCISPRARVVKEFRATEPRLLRFLVVVFPLVSPLSRVRGERVQS